MNIKKYNKLDSISKVPINQDLELTFELTKNVTNDILCVTFLDIIFQKFDTIDVFLDKIEIFNEKLNLDKISCFNDLNTFMDIVNSMFSYIKDNKKDLLLLKGSELYNLKINFREIQKAVESMFDNEDLIGTILKSNYVMTKKSLIQMHELFYRSFENIYYIIIPPEIGLLPKKLEADKIIEKIKNPNFIMDDNMFYTTISDMKEMCTYIIEENLSELNFNQLNDIKSNIQLLISEINNILSYSNKIDKIKISTLKGIVDSTGRTDIVKAKLDKLLWKKELENFSYENTTNMISGLPGDSAEELCKDEEKFNIFLNEFRRVSTYILLNKNKLEKFDSIDLQKIKALLVEVFSRINEIGEKAEEDENQKINFNTKILREGKLAREFGIFC